MTPCGYTENVATQFEKPAHPIHPRVDTVDSTSISLGVMRYDPSVFHTSCQQSDQERTTKK